MSEVVKLETPVSVAAIQSESGALLSMIERAARDPAVDVAKMERLFQMQERAEAQRAKAAYLAALAQMQSELPAVARRGKGHNDKKYARFEDIVEAVKPVMSAHGFSLTFRVAQSEKSMTVTGVLGHAQGHTESTDMTLPADTSGAKNPVQAWGSSASYGKRYVTLTLLCIATEDEDDDGRTAASAKRKSSAQSKRDGTTERFNEIKVAFETAATAHDLRELSREHHDEINSMPEKWAALLSDAWDLRSDELKARTA